MQLIIPTPAPAPAPKALPIAAPLALLGKPSTLTIGSSLPATIVARLRGSSFEAFWALTQPTARTEANANDNAEEIFIGRLQMVGFAINIALLIM
jgi:hypothetical protein